MRTTRVEAGAGLGVSGGTVVPNNGMGLRDAFINLADGSVNKTVTGDVSLLLFAKDAGFLQTGASYTGTAAFTNGARYVGTLSQLPAQEAVGATFGVRNDAVPAEGTEGTVTEAESPVWSTENVAVPAEETGEIVTEAESPVWSVENATIPSSEGTAGPTEAESPVWSVENATIPSSEGTAGPTEAESPVWSARNEVVPEPASEPGTLECSSPIFSAHNDPSLPPPSPHAGSVQVVGSEGAGGLGGSGASGTVGGGSASAPAFDAGVDTPADTRRDATDDATDTDTGDAGVCPADGGLAMSRQPSTRMELAGRVPVATCREGEPT